MDWNTFILGWVSGVAVVAIAFVPALFWWVVVPIVLSLSGNVPEPNRPDPLEDENARLREENAELRRQLRELEAREDQEIDDVVEEALGGGG